VENLRLCAPHKENKKKTHFLGFWGKGEGDRLRGRKLIGTGEEWERSVKRERLTRKNLEGGHIYNLKIRRGGRHRRPGKGGVALRGTKAYQRTVCR